MTSAVVDRVRANCICLDVGIGRRRYQVLIGACQSMKKRSAIWTLSTEELKLIVAKSNTITEILRGLNLSPVGGGHTVALKLRLRQDNISTEHFDGKLQRQRQYRLGLATVCVPLETKWHLILCKGTILRPNQKTALLNSGRLGDVCSICGIPPIWNEKLLRFHVDHQDGDHTNNEIENLRALCPNCHSQTDNFAGRNKKRKPIVGE